MGRMKEEFMRLVDLVMEGECIVVEGRKLADDIESEIVALFNEVVLVMDVGDGRFSVELKDGKES